MKPDPVRAALLPTAYGGGAGQNSRSSPASKGSSGHCAQGSRIWSTFWQEFGQANAPQERCFVPGDGRDAVDRHWAHFADGLAAGARVIDLGCGAGIAGRNLLRRRSDLRVTGVDWANVPTTLLANLTIHPRVSMEALPFGDGCFDAAISLFGIEYGKMDETARELGRVLRPGARFSFLVHHCESEIAREGGARRRALRGLISGKMKGAFLAGNVVGVGEHRAGLKKQFPDEPMVDLVSDHFRRNITRTRAERQQVWEKLASELEPEISLLMQLERSAKSAEAMGAWLVPLLLQMNMVRVCVLRRGSGEPIAWEVSGAR